MPELRNLCRLGGELFSSSVGYIWSTWICISQPRVLWKSPGHVLHSRTVSPQWMWGRRHNPRTTILEFLSADNTKSDFKFLIPIWKFLQVPTLLLSTQGEQSFTWIQECRSVIDNLRRESIHDKTDSPHPWSRISGRLWRLKRTRNGDSWGMSETTNLQTALRDPCKRFPRFLGRHERLAGNAEARAWIVVGNGHGCGDPANECSPTQWPRRRSFHACWSRRSLLRSMTFVKKIIHPIMWMDVWTHGWDVWMKFFSCPIMFSFFFSV